MIDGDSAIELAQALGIPIEDAIEEIVGLGASPEDYAAALDWMDSEEGIGAFILGRLPNLSDANRAAIAPDVQKMAKQIHTRLALGERLMGAAAATKGVEQAIRANGAIGLYTTNAGSLHTAGDTLPLRPAEGGALKDTDLEFKSEWTFMSLTADPRDCAAGFRIKGGQSFGFKKDGLKPFPYDVNLTMFRPELRPHETPLASLMRRSPPQDTPFVGEIVLASTADTEFYGLTLQIFSVECQNGVSKFRATFGDLPFRSLAAALADAAARRTPGLRLRSGIPGFNFNRPGIRR